MNEREIFLEALDKTDLSSRNAFLDEACGDDAELRQNVEQLLQASNDAGSFLEKPPEGIAPTVAAGENDTVDDVGGELSLAFLEPSDKPNCLGTLGAYEVAKVVGRGGMGLVLRAFDTKLDRIVAIKIMAPELAANAMAVRRFLREARAAAAVSHDHVVTIHAIDEDNKPPFIVMEYVEGQSLQEKIDTEGAFDVKQILRIGMQTAAGLAAAHRQGLVHRDIKPANILLENGVERVKITDFGLARAVDDVSVTQTGQIAGTPQYMSPEQAQGHTIDARSDLFSLGSVLYAMCTGRPPFRADTAVAMLRRVTDDNPRAIRERNVDIPDWLEAVTFKLLEKEPGARFQSAENVAELLNQYLAHMQHPTTTPKPATTTLMRNKSRGWYRELIFAICVLIAIGVIKAAVSFLTNYGTLVVKSDLEDVQLEIHRLIHDSSDETGRRSRMSSLVENVTGSQSVSLRSGAYIVFLSEPEKEIELSQRRFVIRRGSEIALTVRRQGREVPSDLPPTESEVANLLDQDALLAMSFEEESCYQHDGKQWVRDISRNANHGILGEQIELDSSGRAGDGMSLQGDTIKIPSFKLHDIQDYTIAFWVFDNGRSDMIPGRTLIRETLIKTNGKEFSNLEVAIDDGRVWWQPGWTSRQSVQMKSLRNSVQVGQWFFVALTSKLTDAQRELRITINEHTSTSQRLALIDFKGIKDDPDAEIRGHLDVGGFNGKIDEFLILPRPLTEQQLNVLYRYGLAGRSLPAIQPPNAQGGTSTGRS